MMRPCLHGVTHILVTCLQSTSMSDAPALFQRAPPAEARASKLCINTNTLNKDFSPRIKVMNNTEKSLRSPVGYFLCLACPHGSLWASWRAIRARQTPLAAIIPKTSPEDRRAYFGWKICFGSQVSSVLWFRELHLNVSHFHFSCIPALMGRRGSSVCFPPEPLLASIVKSQCWCFFITTPHRYKIWEDIFIHTNLLKANYNTSFGSDFLPMVFYVDS